MVIKLFHSSQAPKWQLSCRPEPIAGTRPGILPLPRRKSSLKLPDARLKRFINAIDDRDSRQAG